MVERATHGPHRSIRLTFENEEFLQGLYFSGDNRYTTGVGPKLNKVLDAVRERQDLVDALHLSMSDFDIIACEQESDEWGD